MGALRRTAGGWALDGEGRLLSPAGEWLARFEDGVLLLYDKRRKDYVPFTLADWLELESGETERPPSEGRRAGTWGR